MNMLYRQIASEKAALNRDKERVTEKLEKKKQKHAYAKQQLEETTKQFERVRDENAQLGQIINQVMLHLKGKDPSGGASPQLGEWRQSLARLSSTQGPFGGIGGLNNSHLSMSALNTSNVAMNRNSNIKKVIRGGGSMYKH